MSEVRKRISKNEWDRTQLHLGVGSGVPPSEFRSLRNCSDQSLFIEQAIRLTLPLGYGERNNRLFELAYQLRWWFPAETPVDEFHPVIRDWHSRALPRIRTKDFSESWSDFQRAWSYGFTTSKFLSSVTAAYRAETLALGFNENQDRVARVFHAADAVTGGTAFWLGSRNIAEITGVCRSSANDWTRSLIDRGLLQVLEPGKFSRKQRSKATVWRWRGPE